MKIGCTVKDARLLSSAKNQGYDYCELMGRYITALNDREFCELLAIKKDSRMPVFGINSYCNSEIQMIGEKYNVNESVLYAKRCSERASALGVQIVGIGSPKSRILKYPQKTNEANEQMEEFLLVTSREFKKFGICVCLEPIAPCYCNYINTIEDAKEIITNIRCDEISIVLDYYNLEYINQADIDYSTYLGYIKHLHISDDEGNPQTRSYLKENKRNIHINRVKKLINAGYRGNITLETDVPYNEEKAKQSLEILREAAFMS